MCQLWTISPPRGRDATVYLRNGRAGQRAKKQTDDRESFSALVGSQLPIFSFFLFPRVERFPLPVLLVLRGIKKTKCATQRTARSWAGSQCRGARPRAVRLGRCVGGGALLHQLQASAPKARLRLCGRNALGSREVEESLRPPLRINILNLNIRERPCSGRIQLRLPKTDPQFLVC